DADAEETWIDGESQLSQLTLHPLATLALTVALCAKGSSYSPIGSASMLSDDGSRSAQFWIGWVLGWVSGVNYVASRINQILKNFREKAPETLSISMFMIAVAANTAYTLSIVLTATSWDLIWPQIPWIVGSAGVLGLDVTIGIQYRHYTRINRDRREYEESLLWEDE
ncbi:hypothetical protein KIPB_010805, partial [Kipferlia bialata]